MLFFFLSLSHILGTAKLQMEQHTFVLNKHHSVATHATTIF